MKDNLEKFILEKRQEFDTLEPGDGVWTKIEKNIKTRKTLNWRIVMGRAAAVILLFAASYLVHEFVDARKEEISHTKEKDKKDSIIPEIREAEVYYSNLIHEKLQEIKPMISENPVLQKEIKKDLNQLDSIYSTLKNDLKDNIANHEVIEAMIENYRLRLSILEDILLQIKPEDDVNNSKDNGYDM